MSSPTETPAEANTASESPPPERVLRRDAERNRRRIIDGARIVFAEHGLGGSYDDIAREAEVGVGTVYRRFPDRQQLIDVLFEEALEEVAGFAEEGLAIEDPWDGLIHFLVGAQERQCADRALRELVLSPGLGESRVAIASARIGPMADRLIARAQEAGVVRQDVHSTDLGVMQLAVCAVADVTRESAPETWRRTLTVLIDGLRSARDTVHPMTVPALTLDQFEAAMLASGPRRR